MKKSVIAVICFALLLAIPFASAGLWGWITGKVSEQPTDVNVPIGNTAPTIPFVQAISAQTPIEAGYTDVIFKFEAYDHDNSTDLDDATALAKFTRGGETTRSAACTVSSSSNEYRNYTCTIRMWYWDGAGSWNVNVTVADLSAARAENSTASFTYNELTALVLSPSTLSWPTVTPGSVNQPSNNDPTVLNNTGNHASDDIEINATNLNGTGSRTDLFVDANLFASSQSNGDECDAGAYTLIASYFTQIINSTDSPATLPRGNLSLGGGTAQENLYYCLTEVDAALIKQTYTTTANGAWTIKII
jgi:hypothetical protein